MMAAVVGGLMLRSVVAGSSATPAGTVGALAVVPATAAGSRLTGNVASPSASLPDSTSMPGVASSAASSPPGVAILTGYAWPLDKAMITLPFGPTSWGEFIVNGQLFHDGVDMATFCGDYVRAAHSGTVLAASRQYDEFMGWVGSLTPYHNLLDTKHWWNSLPITVVIDDGDGYRSIYAHESKVIVAPGQTVVAGQVIGYEGMTGNATGCHVHFGLFSPTEIATFEMDPTIVRRTSCPPQRSLESILCWCCPSAARSRRCGRCGRPRRSGAHHCRRRLPRPRPRRRPRRPSSHPRLPRPRAGDRPLTLGYSTRP